MKILRISIGIAVLLCCTAIAFCQAAPKASTSVIAQPAALRGIVSTEATKAVSSETRISELTKAVNSLLAYNEALEKRVTKLAAENEQLLLELKKLKPSPAGSKEPKTP